MDNILLMKSSKGADVRKPFIFVGEALALDFVNTLVIMRGKPCDLLQTPDDLMGWWEDASRHYPEMERVRDAPKAEPDALLKLAKELRDNLRSLFISAIEKRQPDEASIHALNRVLQMGHPALEWQTGRAPETVYWPYDDGRARVLIPIALSVLYLLTQADLSRLHKCRNNRCILLFYDTTKSGTRQWCSPQCLDRERSAQRYQKKKQAV